MLCVTTKKKTIKRFRLVMMMMMEKKFPGVYMTKFRSIPSTYINRRFPCINQYHETVQEWMERVVYKKKRTSTSKSKIVKLGILICTCMHTQRLEVLREEKKGKLGSIFDPSVETELNQQSSMQVCIHSWV